MTLIAPIDTGAWEGSCNESMGNQMNQNVDPCASIETEQACNANSEMLKICDWRGGRCINTAKERKECRLVTVRYECDRAPGPDNPFQNNWGEPPHFTRSQLFEQATFDGGCSWNISSGKCEDFSCSSAPTEQGCTILRYPLLNRSDPDQNKNPPRHCVWKNGSALAAGGACEKEAPADFCTQAAIAPPPSPPMPQPGPPSPPMPQESPRDLCDGYDASRICLWTDPTDNGTDGKGRCVPLRCEQIKNQTICLQHQSQPESDSISCSWVPGEPDNVGGEGAGGEAGHCISFGDNCTKLETKAACGLANQTCSWNRTKGSGGDSR